MKKIIILSILFLIGCLSYFLITNQTYNINEKDIQAQIDKKFPFKIDGKRVDVLIDSVQIKIESNNLKTNVYYEAEMLGEAFTGIYSFDSTLAYQSGSVYLSDIKNTEITLIPSESKKVKSVKNLIDKYKNKDQRIQKMFDNSALVIKNKIEEMVDERVRNHFKNKPIYVLKNKSFKHDLVELALKDLILKEGQVELKFSI